jgi:hydrogenase expression/formation protein HypD
MDELRDKKVIKNLLQQIREKSKDHAEPVKIMEVCGTHAMTVHRYGLRQLLEDAGILMISGPGCPVCITPNEFHEAAITLVQNRENFVLATFGDMTRVPTKSGSLQTIIPAASSQVKIVYSPEESLEFAKNHPEKEIVFFGVGFETTIPAIAMTVKSAHVQGTVNYSILSAFWLIPPPLKALIESKDVDIQGFLYPGHVSAIIGEHPYRFVAEEYGIPGAITGFEPADILLSILSILDQITRSKALVANEYSRVVNAIGNVPAQRLMEEMLEVKDSHWRGLGIIPGSGLKLREKFSAFDAELKYDLKISACPEDLPGCHCGEVLQGKIIPPECPLFSVQCNPESPYGPCMVSFEGACLTYYKYARG